MGFSFEFQMANIGSEVYRALKYHDDPSRFQGSYGAALELFEFTIEALSLSGDIKNLREARRAREEFCDYFSGNSFHTDPARMQRYYDQFVSLAR